MKFHMIIFINILAINFKLQSQDNLVGKINNVFDNLRLNFKPIDSVFGCAGISTIEESKYVYEFKDSDSIEVLINQLYDNCTTIDNSEIINLYQKYSTIFLNSWGKYFYHNRKLCKSGELAFQILIKLRNINHVKYIEELVINQQDIFEYYTELLKYDYNFYITHKIDTSIYIKRPKDLNDVNYFLLKTNHWQFDNGLAYYRLNLFSIIENNLFNWIREYDLSETYKTSKTSWERWKFENATTYLSNRNNPSDLLYFRENMSNWFENGFSNRMLELVGTTQDSTFIHDYIKYFIEFKLYSKTFSENKYVLYTCGKNMLDCFQNNKLVLNSLINIIKYDEANKLKYLELFKYLNANEFIDYIKNESLKKNNSTEIQNKLNEVLQDKITNIR